MPLDIPNLDDRRWTDLVEEGRALIPRLAPRWTDHNVHDPGITFIELFAWLAEMQIYQLNRVGARHREAFARLEGLERRGRTPARVEVLVGGAPTTSAPIPAGTQLVPTQRDVVVFETVTDVTLTRSRLTRVVVDDGSGATDQTEANSTAGVAFLAFGERADEGAELRLALDRLYPGERELRLNVSVFSNDLGGLCGALAPSPATELQAVDPPPPVELAWEYRADEAWRPLQIVSDETGAFTRSGAIVVALPAGAPAAEPFWMRARIRQGFFDIEPRLRHIRLNMLPCVQIETVRDELLGRGDGRPDRSFSLAKTPLFVAESEPRIVSGPTRGIRKEGNGPSEAQTLVLEVAGHPWQQVQSLEVSGPQSAHYMFDRETGTVTFGNGLNGRIPAPGEEIRVRSYRTTAGGTGNVANNLSWRFRTAAVAGATLTNPEAATGGAEPETLEELELRAQASLHRPHRAVTLEDLERLALGTPGAFVARAAAIPNCPRAEMVTVVVVPKVRPGRSGPPRKPSDPFLDLVRQHLEPRRLLGDQLRVIGPTYMEVGVMARLRLARGAGSAQVIERARAALARFFDGDTRAVSSSDDPAAVSSPCPTRWPFGRSVFPSEVYAVLDRVNGVDSVSALTLRGSIDSRAVSPHASGALRVPRTGLVYSGEHDLTTQDPIRGGG